MADSQSPESNIDLSAIISPHLGTPGRGLEGDAEILRQSIFKQRLTTEKAAAQRSPQEMVDARTIQEQSFAARRAEAGGIKRWHVGTVVVLLAGGLLAGRHIMNQPAQAEQLPVYPSPVSTQEEPGFFDNIQRFADTLGGEPNNPTSAK